MIFVLHILVNFTPQKRMNHDEKKRIVWDHSMSLSVSRCPLITIFCVTPLTAILLFCLSFLNGFPIKYNTVQVSFSTLKPQNWYLPQKSSIGRSQWINLDISVDGNEPNIKYSRPLKASVSLCFDLHINTNTSWIAALTNIKKTVLVDMYCITAYCAATL